MVLYCRDGQTHLRCHIRDRIPLDPAQHECPPLLHRQLFHKIFQASQCVAGMKHAFITDGFTQFIQISHVIEGNDGLPSGLIDQKVARDPMHEGQAVADLSPVFDGIRPHQNLGNDVVQIHMRRQDSAQATAQKPPARQDDILKPSGLL